VYYLFISEFHYIYFPLCLVVCSYLHWLPRISWFPYLWKFLPYFVILLWVCFTLKNSKNNYMRSLIWFWYLFKKARRKTKHKKSYKQQNLSFITPYSLGILIWIFYQTFLIVLLGGDNNFNLNFVVQISQFSLPALKIKFNFCTLMLWGLICFSQNIHPFDPNILRLTTFCV